MRDLLLGLSMFWEAFNPVRCALAANCQCTSSRIWTAHDNTHHFQILGNSCLPKPLLSANPTVSIHHFTIQIA